MEVIAKSKQVRISPRKVRLVADMVRQLSIEKALDALMLTHKRAALPLEKTLRSALANAVNNAKLSKENLVIKRIDIDEGQKLKRFRPSTRGRTHPYKKRASSITIVLAEKQGKEQNGTKS